MAYIHRDEAIKRIRKALKTRSGKTWSVTGGRGTGWCWITVQAPPKRRVAHKANPAWKVWDLECKEPRVFEYKDEPGRDSRNLYTSTADCKELARLFRLDQPVHYQGLNISPDSTEFYVARAEKGTK